MALLVTNEGEGIVAEAFLNKVAPQDLKLKLFKNDYTPVDASTAGSFTEADFLGYVAANLAATSWTVTTGAPTTLAYPQVTFASTAGTQNQNVYGYLVTQVTSGKAIWAERFSDGPYNVTNSGDQIKVTLNMNVKKAGE